ncbi:hypothetical protein ACH5RR_007476 [Cinchona calisaya]|uniref:WRC domain-containing protein n=1 Tax=Cinchona calisaya TaxID=153742 RepID=A0ABD3ARY6_9GENT
MKMEENIIHNRYGRGWSCSEPSFGNYSEYEHHLDASKNTRRKEKKKNNNIPCKVTESKIKSTPKTEFTDLDNRLNFSDTESCDECDDYHECVFKVENCSF